MHVLQDEKGGAKNDLGLEKIDDNATLGIMENKQMVNWFVHW